ALLAIRRAGQRADLQFHQPLAGKADHLAQQVSVRALFQQRPQVHHLIGHRWFLVFRVERRNPNLNQLPPMTFRTYTTPWDTTTPFWNSGAATVATRPDSRRDAHRSWRSTCRWNRWPCSIADS